MNWARKPNGFHVSDCGRWTAYCVGKKNQWCLSDNHVGGRRRYYDSLKSAKTGAVYVLSGERMEPKS